MTSTLLLANLCTMGLNLVYAVLAMVVGLAALKYVDRLLFPEINFVQEIRRGNIASAIFVGTVVLFLGLILSSAVR